MEFRIIIPVAMTLLLALAGFADPTPPVPHYQETPLPPAVTLPAPAQQLADVPNRPLTVVEAAQIALRHQPSLQSAAVGIATAKAQLQQVRAALGPNLNAGVGSTSMLISNSSNGTSGTGGTGGGNSQGGYQLSATVNQLLFDFNHTRDLVRQSIAQEQSSQAALTMAQSDLVFQTKQAFYNYAKDLQLMKVNEANVKDSQGHLGFAKAKYDDKLGLLSDVINAETAVSSAIFNLNLAQNIASLARVNLAQLMGIDPRTPIQVADSLEPAIGTDDLNALVGKALGQRPEILQAQSNLNATQYALRAARCGNAPTIAGSLGWNQRGQALSMNASNALTLGVNISWSAYDSGLVKGRADQAKANIDNAHAQLMTTQQSVISDVSQSYLNLMTALQRISSANDEVTNAQQAFKLVEGRFTAGVGVFLDVLDAETALTTALTNQVNANTTVQLSRAAFAHALFEDSVVRQLPKTN